MDQISPLNVEFNNGKRVWTVAQRIDIIKMFNENFSMGVIADKYGCTRGCISGIINRERKAGNKTIKARQIGYRAKSEHQTILKTAGKPERPKGLPLGSFLLKEPIKKESRVRLTMVESDTAVTFKELESHHCKWPMGNPRQSDFRFCGCQRLAGKPYCEAHAYAAGQHYTGPRPVKTFMRLPR